jgi:hypothetical protein
VGNLPTRYPTRIVHWCDFSEHRATPGSRTGAIDAVRGRSGTGERGVGAVAERAGRWTAGAVALRPALDEGQRRARRWREVQDRPRASGQPAFDRRRLVRRAVVEHEMHAETGTSRVLRGVLSSVCFAVVSLQFSTIAATSVPNRSSISASARTPPPSSTTSRSSAAITAVSSPPSGHGHPTIARRCHFAAHGLSVRERAVAGFHTT